MGEASNFAAAVRRELSEAGSSLERTGVASSFEIVDADGVDLVVTRATDGRTGRVTMTGTTEAFLLDIDGTYADAATAYDDESKWETVRDFVACLVAYLELDYYEEIGERNGRVVHRVLHLTVPGGERTLSARDGLRGFVARTLGYRKSIVRPASS